MCLFLKQLRSRYDEVCAPSTTTGSDVVLQDGVISMRCLRKYLIANCLGLGCSYTKSGPILNRVGTAVRDVINAYEHRIRRAASSSAGHNTLETTHRNLYKSLGEKKRTSVSSNALPR